MCSNFLHTFCPLEFFLTLCILIGSSTLYGHRLSSSTKIEFLLLEIVLVLANSVDPDEMSHYVSFHLAKVPT